MKKKFVVLFFIALIVLLVNTFKTKAMYVIDNKTLLDSSLEIEQLMEDRETSVLEQMDNAIEIMSENNNLFSIWAKATKMKENYSSNRPFLEANYYDNQSVLVDTYIFSILSLFWHLNWKLSFELLLQSYITTIDNTSYTPYYGYIMEKVPTMNTIAHSSAVSGIGNFGKRENLDLFFSIHYFDYTKSSPSSTMVQIVDVYNFERDNDFWHELKEVKVLYPIYYFFNRAIDILGYYNSLGILKTYSVKYTVEHSYSKSYIERDEDYHTVLCECDANYIEKHNFKRITNKLLSESPNYVVNQYKCTNCGYIKIEDNLII